MIIKKVISKHQNQSSFKTLSEYILDTKNGSNKVDFSYFSNCDFDENDKNISFIHQMQSLNTTTRADKTLHLIISFQEDERPSRELLKQIESELLNSIGMEHHHRLSVLHDNTNNYHMHIAINRIDPQTHKRIDVFQDIVKMQKKAQELEKKFNLKVDNHTPRKDLEPNEQNKSVIEKFKEWTKNKILDELKEILSESDSTIYHIHNLLSRFNLELKIRANGFVIKDRSRNLFVKASSIDSKLSKFYLTQRFGEVSEFNSILEPEERFGKLKSEHWKNYQALTELQKGLKSSFVQEHKIKNREEFLAINEEYKRYKRSVRALKHIDKRLRVRNLKQLELKRKIRIKLIKDSYQRKKSIFFAQHKRMSYEDYLIGEVLKGDILALEFLKKYPNRNPKQDEKAIIGVDDRGIFLNEEPKIGKNGFVFYDFGATNSRIIDKGNHLKIVNGSDMVILEALEMARAKYSKELEINGDNEFKIKVLKIVKHEKMDIIFKNPEMRSLQKVNIGMSM